MGIFDKAKSWGKKASKSVKKTADKAKKSVKKTADDAKKKVKDSDWDDKIKKGWDDTKDKAKDFGKEIEAYGKGIAAGREQEGGKGDDMLRGIREVNIIDGNGGDDDISATGLKNTLDGGSGNDVVIGRGLVKNEMYGGTGKDVIEGYGSVNEAFGGKGDDKVTLWGGTNYAEGGAGNDTISLHGAYNKAKGGDGNDVIKGYGAVNDVEGGAGSDRIEMFGGVNIADGGSGNDVMIGIGGVNVMEGGAGNDKMLGVGGYNYLKGGAGDDLMVAAGQANLMEGGAGNDIMLAGGAINMQFAGNGADVMLAGGMLNIQHGGAGQDIMIGGGVSNIQVGADGDDILIAGGEFNAQFGDQIDWKGARDIGFEATGTKALSDILAEGMGVDQNAGLKDLFDRFDSAMGGDATGDDLMIAFGKGNIQMGGGGGDVMVGGGKANVQSGGAGEDLMIGAGNGNVQFAGSGADVMIGLGQASAQSAGGGNDVLIGINRAEKTGVAAQDGGAGDDLFLGYSGRGGASMVEKMNKFATLMTKAYEKLNGMGGSSEGMSFDKMTMKAESFAASQILPQGVIFQEGGAGDDTFFSDAQMMVQNGGAGEDLFIGTGDTNATFGGAGADVMITDSAATNVLAAGDDDDMMIDFGVLAMFAAQLWASEELEFFADTAEALATPYVSALNTIATAQEAIEKINPLTAIKEFASDVVEMAESFTDLNTSQYFGGKGNDVIAAGNGGGDMVGGKGGDTYLFTFGADGEFTIDDAGFDAVRDWGRLVGAEGDFLNDLSTGGGGNDTLEIRNWMGAAELEPENIEIEMNPLSGDMVIGLQTKGGADMDWANSITIKNMDADEGRIETLRIVDGDGYYELDLAAVWKAGAYGPDMFSARQSGKTDAQAEINKALVDLMGDGSDVFDMASGAFDTLQNAAGDLDMIFNAATQVGERHVDLSTGTVEALLDSADQMAGTLQDSLDWA